jgi:hypothetical protein
VKEGLELAQIKGAFLGPSDAAGTVAFLNRLDSRRVETLAVFGGHAGIWEGFVYSQVGGQMQLSFTAGIGMAAERDGSQVELRRGYVIWNDVATVVQFGAASAANRNDAVVLAAVDPEDGAFGTGALVADGHLVVIPGVSGTTTVRTDAQIATWLGRGGWVRLLDVPILSTDTQINTATIVPTPAAIPWLDSGTLTNVFTVASGWSIQSQNFRRRLGVNWFNITFTRTGANITSISGNIANTAVATWDTTKYPILIDCSANAAGNGYDAVGLLQTGTVYVTAVANDIMDIVTGDQLSLAGSWPS